MTENPNGNLRNSPYFNRLRSLTYLDCFFFAILGYLVVYYFTRYSGIGVSPDSIMYTSTAQNLHDNFSIITYNGKPLTFFPVFYPFFLSICIFLSGGTPVAAGPVINGILFGATIFVSGWITTRFKNPSHVYRWVILLSVLLSPALQQIFTYLWSETLFILEVLLFVIAYRQYIKTHRYKQLIIAAVVAAIACITRYAGVTLIGAAGLLLLTDGELTLKKKLTHLLVFTPISVSLLLGNLAMNRLNTGLSTGTRLPAITPLSENLRYFGITIMEWAGLPATWANAAVLITILIIIVLVGLLTWHLLTRQPNGYQRIFIIYALTYTLFIIIIASVSRFEQINSRLISPVFIPMLISLTSWAPDVLRRLRPAKKWLYATPLIVVMAAFYYVVGKADLQRYDDFYEYGIPGYTDDDWNKSEFIVFLKNNRKIFKPGTPILTDADEAVYMFTGMQSILLPHKDLKKELDQFNRYRQFYLIDFKRVNTIELIDLDYIKKHRKVTLRHDYTDGAVYWVE